MKAQLQLLESEYDILKKNKFTLEDKVKESFHSWADKYLRTQSKKKYDYNPKDNVVAVLRQPVKSAFSGKVLDTLVNWMLVKNIVTNDGDAYYARQGANEAHAANEDFGDTTARFEMGTTAFTTLKASNFGNWDVAGTSKIAGSRLGFTGTYPKTNDTGDADNTGDAIDAVSYAINYTATSWSDTTVETGCIHENASPATTTKLLTGWSFTQFSKTTSDTLKVFVNHTMNGV